MNRTALWFAVVLAGAASTVAAAEAGPKIMVQMTIGDGMGFQHPGETAETLASMVQGRIRKAFPCTSVITTGDVGQFLGLMRKQMLLGTPEDPESTYEQRMQNLGGAIGADYIVTLQASSLGAQWVLTARWLDNRKYKPLAVAQESVAAGGSNLVDACERAADKLIEDVAYFEPCSYTGPVKIRVHATRSAKDREEHATFCNGSDQQYVRTASQSTEENTEFDLTRTRRDWGTGTVKYESSLTQELEELDPCHDCTPTRKGFRTYTERQRVNANIIGLSEYASTKHRRFSDVRLYLKFRRDGTYTLQLVAASVPGQRHVRLERKAEGQCDTRLDKPNEDYTAKVDLPFGHIIGPFQGKPTDRTLADQQQFKIEDPATKEETTIDVDFQLSRG